MSRKTQIAFGAHSQGFAGVRWSWVRSPPDRRWDPQRRIAGNPYFGVLCAEPSRRGLTAWRLSWLVWIWFVCIGVT